VPYVPTPASTCKRHLMRHLNTDVPQGF
jgi:hypothetical protein